MNTPNTKNTNDYDSNYAERQLARSRHPLRRLVKGFYLRNLLANVVGPSVDFGCGAGQILEQLPDGSVGLEVNSHLVDALCGLGLDARLYPYESDQLTFKDLPSEHFKTFIMSHVLEHFEDAAGILKTVLDSCKRLGVKRVIIVVPGKKGYSFDDTHKTFIDRSYIEKSGLSEYNGFVAKEFTYFPINIPKISDYFTFHELKIVFDAV